jgi:hypothetical protein
MMHRTVFTLLALALIAIPLTADAEYRHLCTSVPGACEYSPAGVPKLLADVCYSPASNVVTLKGTAPCPSGTNTFNVIYGEVVDSLTGEVAAYVPLDDACAAGHCVDYVPHDDPQEYPMCCENGGPCWPGGGCAGIHYWCHDGVCNEDGTVTCYNAELL